jgi:hypothetical protein
MLVVLDSNVLLSGILSPEGAAAQVYRAWREKRFELVTCAEQIEEIRRASRYPRFRAALQPHRFGTLLNNLNRAHLWAGLLPHLHDAEDPTDSYLLNLAAAARAHYLVTGDKRSRILDRKRISETRIYGVREFCAQVLHL